MKGHGRNLIDMFFIGKCGIQVIYQYPTVCLLIRCSISNTWLIIEDCVAL